MTHGLVPDFVNPLVHEGEVTFERQLPGNTSFSAAYVFSRGLHLPMFVDANLAPSTTTKSYNVLDASGNVAQTVTYPFYTQRANATGVILVGSSDVNSWYNSMVLTFRKPMSHGIEFLANYTLSKATDGGQVPGQYGTFFGTDTPVDPYDRKLEYAPFGPRPAPALRHQRRVVAAHRRHWEQAARPAGQRLELLDHPDRRHRPAGHGQISGFPSGGVNGGLTGAEVSNSGGSVGGRVPWIARNSYRLPTLHNLDFRIGRQFSIAERFHLQFIGEAFNLFNTTNITAVNTTQYNFSNGNLLPNAAFMAPTTASNFIYASRQLQISARLTF